MGGPGGVVPPNYVKTFVCKIFGIYYYCIMLWIWFKSTSARYGIRNTRLGSKYYLFVRGQRFQEKTNVSVTQKTQEIIYKKIKVKKLYTFTKQINYTAVTKTN